MYHKTVKFLCCAVAITGFLGCATTKPVVVHFRQDVDTSQSKILVFPLLLTDGNKIKPANSTYSNPIADVFFGKKWSSALGSNDTTIIPKIVLDKIPNAYSAIDALIANLDTVSAIEQTSGLTKFLNAITKQFGDRAFAFALIFETEDEYKASKQVRLNMGLFDSKKLTWKWITKHSFSAGMVPTPYKLAVNKLVTESYDALKEESGGDVR